MSGTLPSFFHLLTFLLTITLIIGLLRSSDVEEVEERGDEEDGVERVDEDEEVEEGVEEEDRVVERGDEEDGAEERKDEEDRVEASSSAVAIYSNKFRAAEPLDVSAVVFGNDFTSAAHVCHPLPSSPLHHSTLYMHI